MPRQVSKSQETTGGRFMAFESRLREPWRFSFFNVVQAVFHQIPREHLSSILLIDQLEKIGQYFFL